MGKLLRRNISILLLAVLIQSLHCTTATSLPEYETTRRFNCPETSSCSCIFVFKDYEIQCPPLEPQVIVRVQPNMYAQIECTVQDQRSYTLLPPMNIGDIPMVQIRRCPLPLGTPIKTILDRLGARKVRALFFQSYGADLGGPLLLDHLKGLRNLERLVLSGSGLSDLPENLFTDMKNLTWLDMKSNNMHLPQNIFNSLEKLEYLELGSNLQDLQGEIFRNQGRLKHLNLWGNALKNLSKEAFVGVPSIIELDLSANTIETFKPDVFTHLKNLTNINLSTNNFKSLPDGLFEHNKKLTRLRLLENRAELTSLPRGLLANLPELEDVRIKCHLRTIPENLFAGSINLRNVSLAGNAIEFIPASLFADQSNLLDLDLSRNKLTALPSALFASARSLLVLKLSHNQLVNISEGAFSGLQDLREIYMDNNKIHRIHPTSFKGAQSLQVINLDSNYLNFQDQESELVVDVQYEFGSPFQYCKELRSLNLRNNSITNIYHDWVMTMVQLENLDLSHNNITMLSYSDLQFLSREITVNLTSNLIGEINFIALGYSAYANEMGMRKVVVLLNSNPLVCNCVILHFIQFIRNEIAQNLRTNLQIITDGIQCASPAELKGRFVSQIHPRELLCPLDSEESSIKKCPSNCRCQVRLYDKAVIFNCSDAGLTAVPQLPTTSSLNLDFVELYVENNNLMRLPRADLPSYVNVTKIYARNNNITTISADNIPKNLEVLDLAANGLQRLNMSALRVLNQTKTLDKLYLSNNPWACDCDASSLVSFVRRHFKKIYDLDRMMCNSGERMAAILPGDLCSRDEGLVIAVSVIIALLGLCIGILAALYYKYQQEVKVWLFAHNMCLWFVTEEELDKDKKYDAFISYSHKDEDFVTEHLVPELESGRNAFKLCLHIRDWVVGEFIPNQITKSVEDSRRTIVVLSPNFLESVWGRMEFRAAHTAALSEKRARVIVIIYGDIGETDHLDPELKAYLKMNTYVKWGDPWFWDKLRYAMPHPSNTRRTMGLVKNAIKSSMDDKLELIKPSPVTPPLTTPPAEQATKNPLIAKLNGELNQNGKLPNGISGHVNGAFIINPNAKQSDV